jgi:hypothetical protein
MVDPFREGVYVMFEKHPWRLIKQRSIATPDSYVEHALGKPSRSIRIQIPVVDDSAPAAVDNDGREKSTGVSPTVARKAPSLYNVRGFTCTNSIDTSATKT